MTKVELQEEIERLRDEIARLEDRLGRLAPTFRLEGLDPRTMSPMDGREPWKN